MMGIVTATSRGDGAFAPSTPPALYPVGGRPAVEHAVDAARAAGADSVALVGADSAVRHRLGSATSVRRVAPDDPATDLDAGDDAVLVLDGATLYDGRGLAALVAAAPATSFAGAASRPAPSTPAYAVPGPDRPPAADRTVTEFVAALQAVAAGDAVAFDYQFDVRRPWEYLAATERALSDLGRSLDGDVHPNAECRGRVRVEAGAAIDAGSVVEGPTLVRTGAAVGPNARVRGSTLVGPDARVGHASEVKNAVLMRDARVPHLSYVGDSVVGPDANVGAGSQVANLRHDGADVRVAHDGDRVSTGRRKFGAVVGEGARLGVGTALDAGVTLGPGATTAPGETVLRDRGVDG
jgi:bifunctional UDP-N-acetylglucosamine pyrophosphorylase/glucosamine-1-phosphate N-acetyltransferase